MRDYCLFRNWSIYFNTHIDLNPPKEWCSIIPIEPNDKWWFDGGCRITLVNFWTTFLTVSIPNLCSVWGTSSVYQSYQRSKQAIATNGSLSDWHKCKHLNGIIKTGRSIARIFGSSVLSPMTSPVNITILMMLYYICYLRYWVEMMDSVTVNWPQYLPFDSQHTTIMLNKRRGNTSTSDKMKIPV